MADIDTDDGTIEPDDFDVEAAVNDPALGAGDDAPEDAAPAPTGDDYEDVFREEPPPEPVVDANGRLHSPDGKFAKKAEAPADAGASPSQDPASDAAPVAGEPPADPFATWAPFTFKADGVEATIDGIRANETHVVIPRTVWDSEFRPKHLANREAWQEERGQWQQRIQQAETAAQMAQRQRSEREDYAQAIIAQHNALMSDPAKLAAFFEDFERQAPILQARIEADTYRSQLQQRQQTEQQARAAAEYEQLFERSADAYEADMRSLLKDPKYAPLATDEEELTDLLAELWNPALVLLDPRGGAPTLNRAPILEQLDRRVAFLTRRQSTWQKTAHAEATNKAAVTSPVTTPRTVAPAKTAPKTTAPSRRPTAPALAAARRITQEDRDSWGKDYESVFED